MTDRLLDVRRLLAEARAGSDDALGQALEACRAYLLLIAEEEIDPELRAKGGASDLVQNTFVDAVQDFAHFHGQTSDEWRAWLRHLLRNNIVDFTRRYREARKRSAGREVAMGHPGDPARHLAGDDTPPGDRAIAGEQAEALRAALSRLPDDYRQVILLRYQEQLSFEEIGKRLERTPNAARMLWQRAFERVKKEMGMPP
jgi:RNA polymerase sigma-70 factor (ECF subfamily)